MPRNSLSGQRQTVDMYTKAAAAAAEEAMRCERAASIWRSRGDMDMAQGLSEAAKSTRRRAKDLERKVEQAERTYLRMFRQRYR